MKPSVEILASKLAVDLEGSRKKGTSSPLNPVKSDRIISRYRERYDWNISDKSEIREAIWYSVVELKKPIGSTLDGYFYCLTAKEVDDYALPHLLSRVQKQYKRIDALKERRNELAQMEANQQSMSFSPIGILLKKELALEIVAQKEG